MKKIRLGSGAGYSGDRIEPAIELAEKGNIQYLIFECLAERTIAIAQQNKLKDPTVGYDVLLEKRMRAALPVCHRNGIKLITNMGAANPVAAMKKTVAIARELGLSGLKVIAVTGDDVFDQLHQDEYTIFETGEPLSTILDKSVSANAYLGYQPIKQALADGADVVITGRVADPALFIGPLAYEFGWDANDWDILGKGTLVGHLMECGGQVTGGYFADPGYKDVDGLARLGFPIAEVDETGSVIITKIASSGGKVTLETCTEQMCYEIHDPKKYITPDVVADFSQVSFEQIGPDRVCASGATGHPKTDFLKTSVGYVDSYIGEGQISYAGLGAVARGRLAIDIVKERLVITDVEYDELRCDLIGINAIHGETIAAGREPYEVRVRIVARTKNMQEAIRIGNEVESLYTNGPAGGGGATKASRKVVGILSVLINRDLVKTTNYSEVV